MLTIKRRYTIILRATGVLALLLSGSASFGQSAPSEQPAAGDSGENGELFRRVIANQKQVDANMNTYERVERVEIRKTGSDPNPSEVRVWRVFPAGTGTSKIPLTTEAKPASAESYRAALEKLQTTLAWAAETGPAQREAYARVEKRKKERNELIDTTRKAFVFAKIGEETRAGRVLVKYEMTRNPAFKPATRNEMLFTRIAGALWIDKETSELAKIEGHVTEDINLALFLAKVYRGSYFMQEWYEMAPGVWLPSYQQYDFDGRKFVVPFSIHERTFYTNYKRVGPPKEAVEVVRGELSKLGENRADP
ncbi:MAG TPA: hypothetical protein VK805_12205 [Candidatus Baltobacteraceae bacterium]|nr:hypothetical protein [Candidatus Baltobacteraceae bacterium]